MPGVLTLASETTAATAFVPEGSATMLIITLMVTMGLVMGLVFSTQIAKEWSR